MRLSLLLLVPLMAGCNATTGDMAAELKEAMAYGTMTDLNKLTPGTEKDLSVRLYQVPAMGENCFIETHGICRYRYYLSVSTFDEQPETNVFKLSHTGEVTGIAWRAEDKIDYAEIELSLSPYTRAALKNNPALKSATTKVLLKVSPKALAEIAQ